MRTICLAVLLAACSGPPPVTQTAGPDNPTLDNPATLPASMTQVQDFWTDLCNYFHNCKKCKAPLTLCSGQCLNFQADINNCGACGNACANAPHVTSPSCSAGVCTGTCAAGWGDCNGDKSCAGGGCEAPLNVAQTDSPAGYPIAGYASGGITNCGACGQTCATTNTDPLRQSHTTNLCVPMGSGSASCRYFDRARCATARCNTGGYVSGRNETLLSLAADAGPDTDTDGIPDAWEVANADPRTLALNPVGVDIDCDGKIDAADYQFISDFPTVGVRDVYLRIRSMPQDPGTGGPCASDNDCLADFVGPFCDTAAGQCSDEPATGHAPGAAVVAMVVSAFAPHNIALHIAAGDGDALLPMHTQYLKFFASDACSNLPAADYFANLKSAAGFGDNSKEQYVYRYMVFAHDWCVVPGTTGNSEIQGNDASVTLGTSVFGVSDPAVAKVMQAGTLMHELGHTLGLTHYPLNDAAGRPLRAPHYLSVMNYRYQLSGISQVQTPVVDTVNSVTTVPGSQRIDYSSVALGSLDESTLDENAGVGAGTDDAITYNCPLGATRVGWAGGPVNWNCNGSSSDVGVVDANIDGDIATDPMPQVLPGREDWSQLRLNMLCSSTFGD